MSKATAGPMETILRSPYGKKIVNCFLKMALSDVLYFIEQC